MYIGLSYLVTVSYVDRSLTFETPNYLLNCSLTRKLCLADAIHNFKRVQITWIVNFFKLADRTR